jgi:hypothetical protein
MSDEKRIKRLYDRISYLHSDEYIDGIKKEVISSERERIKGIINSLTTDGSYLTQEQVKYLLKEIDKEVKTE